MTTASVTIAVRVLLFAQFREALGGREIQLQVTPGTTPREVLGQVTAASDRLRALGSVVRFMVNGEFVSGDEPLCRDDELAFLPPVAGG